MFIDLKQQQLTIEQHWQTNDAHSRVDADPWKINEKKVREKTSEYFETMDCDEAS